MVDKHVTINFGDPKDDTSAGADRSWLTITDDEDTNPDNIPAGTASFVLVERSPEAPYRLLTSEGSAAIVATDIPVTVTDEEVLFDGDDEASLDHKPADAPVYTWVGSDHGIPALEGRTLSLADEVVGILNVSYTYMVDRWEISGTSSEKVLVVGIMSGECSTLIMSTGGPDATDPDDVADYNEAFAAFNAASNLAVMEDEDNIRGTYTISYSDGSSGDYNLKVLDYCTDEPLEGVNIVLDGVSIGATDADGIIDLGTLLDGSEHTLEMTKTGYQDSETDDLNNDEFTI